MHTLFETAVMKRRNHLEDVNVDESLILKSIRMK
jgi:hypothetical protein